MRKLISMLLAAALLMGNLSMAAFAVDPAGKSTETTPLAEKTEEPVETTVPTEQIKEPVETTAPTEQIKEPVETTAPTEQIKEPVETTAPTEQTKEPAETTVPTEKAEEPAETTAPTEEVPKQTEVSQGQTLDAADTAAGTDPIFVQGKLSLNKHLGDNGEMLESYLQKILYANNSVDFFSTGGRDYLNIKEKQFYDEIAKLVVDIANGNACMARLDGQTITLTLKDLGLSNLWANGLLSETAKNVIFQFMENAIFAVLEDYPYECYWIAKEEPMPYGFSYRPGGDSVTLEYYFEFPVASHFAKAGGAVGGYEGDEICIEVDPSTTNAGSTARKAADYAKEIVAQSDYLDDWDKLDHYKDVICQLVVYDDDAAIDGPNDYNGSSPWQLINVFDRDPRTNVVCEGYSKAFQYLCELSSFRGDVTCYQDSGTTYFPGGVYGPHMWNVVDINGRKLLADLTNSDTGTIGYDGSLFLTLVTHIPNGFSVRSIDYVGVKYLPDEQRSAEFVQEKPATCTEDGVKAHYIAADGRLFVKVDGADKYVNDKDLVIPALGHKWTVEYKWSEDGKSCEALHICGNNEKHNVKEKAIVTSKITTPATCEGKGKTTYTATFKSDWAEPQTKVLEDVEALGHKWTVEYRWSEDGKACEAVLVCSNDAEHNITEKATVTSKITTPATCEGKGETTYTATFKSDWAKLQTKVLEDVEALGHKWTVKYRWSEDGKTCKAICVCSNDAEHNMTEKATVTSQITTPATCGEYGKTTYTATFKADWAKPQTKILKDIAATGKHVYDNDEDDACNVCGHKRGPNAKTIPIYRLYNPFNSQHLLCNNEEEKQILQNAGWGLDGIAWHSVTEGRPVYRLYNPYGNFHMYSMDQNEIDKCTAAGWDNNGPLCFSANASKGIEIHRLYNPFAKKHMYTIHPDEIDKCVAAGWKDEGIAWYAAK